MRLNFDNLGSVGIVKDTSAYDLPMAAWTDGNNVRFDDNKVSKYTGYESVYGTPGVAPYYAMPVVKQGTLFWFYASLAAIYGTDGTSHADLSSGTAAATADINWNGGVLAGGVAILNNGVDTPQMWTGTTLSDNFADLSNWPTGMVARVIRPYKQFLVAADIDENVGAGRVGNLLRWSHPASAGSVPTSWDYTDLTVDAGRTSIQGGDYIVDMLPLRDTNIIYKEKSTHAMQFVGGRSKFVFRQIFGEFGILSRRCVKEFMGQHFVVGVGDVRIHDGSNMIQPFSKRWVKWLFDNIDGDNYERSFVTIDYDHSEVWTCFPSTGFSLPNQALVWNWKDNTVYPRDLPPGTAHIGWGTVDPSVSAAINAVSGTYADQNYQFDEQSFSGGTQDLLICDTTRTLFYRDGYTEQFNGTNISAFVQRDVLPLGRQTQNGIKYEPERIKMVREIWPVITGTPGGIVYVEVGFRYYQDDPVSWKGPYPFVIGQDHRIAMRGSGRIVDIRFSSDSDITWNLISYGVEYELGGVR